MIRPATDPSPKSFTEFEDDPKLVARIGLVSVAAGDQGIYLELPGPWQLGWDGVTKVVARNGGKFGVLGDRKVWRVPRDSIAPIGQQVVALLQDPRQDKKVAFERQFGRVEHLVQALRRSYKQGFQPPERPQQPSIQVGEYVRKRLAQVLPAGFALKGYQCEGVEFLEQNNGQGLIGDEQGLGKTPTATAFLLMHQEHWPALVMCPSSVKMKWEAELNTWGKRVGLKAVAYQNEKHGEEIPKADVVILTFDSLSERKPQKRKGKDGKPLKDEQGNDVMTVPVNRKKFFTEYGFKSFVLDEIHYGKNDEALRTDALYDVILAAGPDCPRIGLSGTPMTNNASELWPMFRLLNPRAVGLTDESPPELVEQAREQFYRDFAVLGIDQIKKKGPPGAARPAMFTLGGPKAQGGMKPGEVINKPIIGVVDSLSLYQLLTKGRAQDEGPFRPACRPTMLRRLKTNVSDLPPKVVRSVIIPAASRERVRQIVTEAKDGLRRAQDHEEREECFAKLRIETGKEKIGPTLDYIRPRLLAGDKLVFFCHHREVLEGLVQGIADMGIKIGSISGSTTNKFKESMRLQNGEIQSLGCTLAAREGLNMTASDWLIQVERQPVPGWELQAEDRIHRIPQTKPVLVEYLHLEDSLDDALARIVERKKKDIRQSIEGFLEWDPDENLSKSIIMQLMKDLDLQAPKAISFEHEQF
jgi:SWI/SNF-related matrix-associated actin-dependent regulator of chromatin subfamily A-like protein 1